MNEGRDADLMNEEGTRRKEFMPLWDVMLRKVTQRGLWRGPHTAARRWT